MAQNLIARQDSSGWVPYEKALVVTQQEPLRQFRPVRIRQLKQKMEHLSILGISNDYVMAER